MAQGGAPPTVSHHVADVDKVEPVLFATAEDGSVWEYQPKFSLPKVRLVFPQCALFSCLLSVERSPIS